MWNTRLKNRTPLRRVSKKRSQQLSVYTKKRREYLTLKPSCELCQKQACEIHHKRGRFGERLNDENNFMALCRECHSKIHNNPKWAYANAFLLNK